MVWSRYVRSNPLFTLAPTEAERAAIRSDLRARVRRAGIGALRADFEVKRNFVLHASQFLARDGLRLEWEPLLTDLGVEPRDATRYFELYDDVERTLEALGRPIIRHNGERRFLASLLREGGLPAFIGDIASLVVNHVTEVGWDTVRDEAARTWVVGRVQQSAGGAARRLLDTTEGRLALADFLSEAASARAALVELGTDLRSLATPDDVRRALEACGIGLFVANEKLLVAVLGSFSADQPAAVVRTEPLRLVVTVNQQRVQLFLRVELDSLDLDAVLPTMLTHASLTAEVCQPPHRLLARESGAFVDAALKKATVDLLLGGRRSATTVDVRYTGSGGTRQVVPLGVLDWPSADLLWFDGDGERLLEQRDDLQSGESLTVVLWDGRSLRGSGAVDVQELSPPAGARRAYAVEVKGAGSLIVEGEVEGEADVQELVVVDRRLKVTVFKTQTPDTLAASGFVRALPDLLVADGLEVEVHARAFGEHVWRPVRRGARGRITLSADRLLRSLEGTVHIRLTAAEGRSWSASWCVLPRGFEISSRDGQVTVRSAGGAVVHADPGQVDRVGDNLIVTPPHGVDRIVLFLSTQGGERLPLPVNVTMTPLRLRVEETSAVTLPLDGTTQLTERQVYAGAFLELDAHPGAALTVSTQRGDVVLSMVQRTARRALLPLTELATYLQRANASPMTFMARLDDSGSYSFRIHVPRLTRPGAHVVDGSLEFEYSLDDLDVPEAPGIALFPLRPAMATRAVVRCEFRRASNGKYVARLGPEHAPTVQGRYIAFLVDRHAEPERPMSAGRAISIPLDLRDLPCPEGATALERALWTRAFENTATEINAKVGAPNLIPFLDAFAATTKDRARYGLESFDLFTTVARRCPWVLLAARPHVPVQERDTWLALWPQQIRSFTWLRFKKIDAALLSRALPTRSSVERMSLLIAAKAAHPMPRAIEYMLQAALFSGDSVRPVSSARQWEINAPAVRPLDWALFQLPQSPAGQRWLTGVDLDADIQSTVDRLLEGQVLRGARALAVRALLRKHDVPHHDASLSPPKTRTASHVMSSIEADWRPLATTPLRNQVKGLDREIAIAAMLLREYAAGLGDLDDWTFAHILDLERRSPELLDFWLVAVGLLHQEGS
jgi:hypothetical protein